MAAAIVPFLRPADSCYSNLIEGYDTLPLDIARALQEDYSASNRNQSLQLEGKAHIVVHAPARAAPGSGWQGAALSLPTADNLLYKRLSVLLTT